MTFTRALSTNNYGPAKFIVDGTTTANGTHSTIAAALTSAASGDTIFIRPGTYTENLTLKAGVNLCAFGCDSSLNQTGHVIISGTCTLTAAGSVTISGIQLQTNSAALLAVTGSAASIVNLENCNLNCTNNTGITFSSSSASAKIILFNCTGDLGTTGIKIFDHSSAGTLDINNCTILNSGGSSTASTISAGSLLLLFCRLDSPVTSSGTGSIGINNSNFSTSTQNVTSLTVGGSGSGQVTNCNLASGSASTISIGSALTITNTTVSSTNTNAITGAGAISYSGICFTGSSTTINTTTQTVSGTLQGSKNTAPTAGMLGEQIRSYQSAPGVSLTNNTAANVTSMSLTAGIWDCSCLCLIGATGATTQQQVSISTTSATHGTNSDNQSILVLGVTGIQFDHTIASYRLTLTSTTTVYLVATSVFSTGTSNAYGRISATRVG